VNPSTQCLLGADNPSQLPDHIDGFFSGGIHGKARYNNVGKKSSLPTLFDQMTLILSIHKQVFCL